MPKDCPDPNVFSFATGHGYSFHSEENGDRKLARVAPQQPGKAELVLAQYRAQKAQLLRRVHLLKLAQRKLTPL